MNSEILKNILYEYRNSPDLLLEAYKQGCRDERASAGSRKISNSRDVVKTMAEIDGYRYDSGRGWFDSNGQKLVNGVPNYPYSLRDCVRVYNKLPYRTRLEVVHCLSKIVLGSGNQLTFNEFQVSELIGCREEDLCEAIIQAVVDTEVAIKDIDDRP